MIRETTCRLMIATLRSIFTRAGWIGVTSQSARRVVARRLADKGADGAQVGELLGPVEPAGRPAFAGKQDRATARDTGPRAGVNSASRLATVKERLGARPGTSSKAAPMRPAIRVCRPVWRGSMTPRNGLAACAWRAASRCTSPSMPSTSSSACPTPGTSTIRPARRSSRSPGCRGSVNCSARRSSSTRPIRSRYVPISRSRGCRGVLGCAARRSRIRRKCMHRASR
jgi:hypothetical protein